MVLEQVVPNAVCIFVFCVGTCFVLRYIIYEWKEVKENGLMKPNRMTRFGIQCLLREEADGGSN